MPNADLWSLLRGTKTEQARGLMQIRKLHDREPTGSTIMELGVAYLWLEMYQAAWLHFRNAIETSRISGDVFYGMAGVAKWCLREPEVAVSEWSAGLKAKYTRDGHGIRMPLLLFFASVVQPGILQKSAVERFLTAKAKAWRIKTWPGPIVQWALSQITENDIRKHCEAAGQAETRECFWLAEFYKAVISRSCDENFTFANSMRDLVDLSPLSSG
jgi:hypothetical protein